MKHTGIDSHPGPLLSSKEVCDIVRTCEAAGVAHFSLGTLVIDFGKKAEARIPVLAPEAAISDAQTTIAKEALEQDELTIKQDQLAQMFVEDPARAEALLLAGELEENGATTDEEA